MNYTEKLVKILNLKAFWVQNNQQKKNKNTSKTYFSGIP